MVDFSYATGLGALQNSIGSFVNNWNQGQQQNLAQQQQNWKLSQLQDAGQRMANNDYTGAAQDFFRVGDAQSGMSLISLGTKIQSTNALNKGLAALDPNAGGSPTPAAAGAAPATASAPSGAPMSLGDTVAYIKYAAAQRGIDPDTAVRVAQSEGLNSALGYGQGAGDRDANGNFTSFTPFQLHYAGNGNGMGGQGLGDAFTAQTGLDARDPRNIRPAIDFALDNAAKGGWGAWHGWKGDQWAGIGSQAAPAPTRVASAPPAPLQGNGGLQQGQQPAQAGAPGQPGYFTPGQQATVGAIPTSGPNAGQLPQGGVRVASTTMPQPDTLPPPSAQQGGAAAAPQPAGGAPQAISVPGYKGTFTRADALKQDQIEANAGEDDNVPDAPTSKEWDAAAAKAGGQPAAGGSQTTAPAAAPQAQADPQVAASMKKIDALTRLLPLAANSQNPDAAEKAIQGQIEQEKFKIQQLQGQTTQLTSDQATARGLPALPDGEIYQVQNGHVTVLDTRDKEDVHKSPEQLYNARLPIAQKLGLQPGTQAYQTYLAEGKIPGVNLNNTQLKMVDASNNSLAALDENIGTVQNAIEQAKAGKMNFGLMGQLQQAVSGVPGLGSESAANTAALDSDIQNTILGNLRTIFGGQVRVAEMNRALSLKPSASQSQAEFLDKAQDYVQHLKNLQANEQNKNTAMSNGSYFQMGNQGAGGPMAPSAPVPVPPGSQRAQGAQPQAQPARVAPADALGQARDAIARGAPRAAVIQRLQQNGIDASGL